MIKTSMKGRLRGLSSAAVIAAAVLGMASMAVAPVQAQGNAMKMAAKKPLKPIPDPSQAEVNAFVKQIGAVESDKPAREFIPGWTRPKQIVLHIDRPDRIAWLQKAAPGVKLVGVYQNGTHAQNRAEAMPYAAEADAFAYVRPNILCDAVVLKAAKKLKWMHSYGSGVDDCIAVAPEVAEGKYVLTNSQKVRSRGMGELTFAMMVMLMRGMDQMVHMDVKQKLENPKWGERGFQMEGRTLLVVGLGGIGTEVAKMANGIGMRVIATRNSSRSGPSYVKYVGLSHELPKMIGQADVVAMTAPLTPETRGMFNTAMFNRMKRGAIFVSISREDVVVEKDLIAALKSGQVGAASYNANTHAPGERSPLAPGAALWSAPNFVYTTHGAAPARPPEGIDDAAHRSWVITREEVRRYVNGDKLLSVVDIKRGY